MKNNLQIPHEIIDQVIAQANDSAPVEACGILAGRDGQVVKLFPMTNVDQSHEHFMMKPEEQFCVARAIRAANLKMLAIYHSHPNSPARPSKEDIRLALMPDVIHVIVSLEDRSNPVVKGFHIDDNNVEQISIITMKVD